MATKKPTAKQLAARKRFAEMARSGAFKRKAKKARAAKSVAKPARKAAKRPAAKRSPAASNNRYRVQLKRGSSWVDMGGHPTLAAAASAAKALHRVAPLSTVRVWE